MEAPAKDLGSRRRCSWSMEGSLGGGGQDQCAWPGLSKDTFDKVGAKVPKVSNAIQLLIRLVFVFGQDVYHGRSTNPTLEGPGRDRVVPTPASPFHDPSKPFFVNGDPELLGVHRLFC